jgi:methylase of polypeptide subunit release factors
LSTSTFSAGTVVEIDNRRHVLLRKLDAELWQLEDERNKRITELAERDLHSAYVQGKLRFCEDDRKHSPSALNPRPPD